MLDLETLGTTPGSIIVAIGACAFDPQSGEIGAEFYTRINVASCHEAGLVLDPETVLWWLSRSAEARAVFDNNEHAPQLRSALDHFTVWLAGICEERDLNLWGNGSDFDNALLAAAYRATGKGQPWRYSANRCLRTANALMPVLKAEELPARAGVHHNALDDARTQARRLMAAVRKLPLGPQRDPLWDHVDAHTSDVVTAWVNGKEPFSQAARGHMEGTR